MSDVCRKHFAYIYHVAFDASADVKHLIVADQQAVLEATLIARFR